jgi:hypothetical protein
VGVCDVAAAVGVSMRLLDSVRRDRGDLLTVFGCSGAWSWSVVGCRVTMSKFRVRFKIAAAGAALSEALVIGSCRWYVRASNEPQVAQLQRMNRSESNFEATQEA